MTTAVAYTEETDPYCLTPQAAADYLHTAPWTRFAAVGDSVAAGIGDSVPGYTTARWTDRVADALRRVQPGLAQLNTGIVGATTQQVIDGQLAAVTAFEPDLVHVSAGANELWTADPDYAGIEARLDELYTRLSAGGAQLLTYLFGEIFDDPNRAGFFARLKALNTITARVSDRHGAIVVDLRTHPMIARPNALSADNIHFTMASWAVFAAENVRALSAWLDTRRTDATP